MTKQGLTNRKVKVKVPATSGNLGPGFDCLGLALALYNELELTVEGGNGEKHHPCHSEAKPKNLISFKKGTTRSFANAQDDMFAPFSSHLNIEIIGEGAEGLPRDSRNIVVGAIFEIFKRAGVKTALHRYTLSLKLVNRIPLARGLGSSAAARLAGLIAANHICGSPFSKDELLDLGARLEGHPDNVAPALYGGICLSGSLDSKFWSHNICHLPKNIKAVVCVPDFELSTAKARRALPEKYGREDAVFNISRATLLVKALLSRRLELLKIAMDDRLHQPYRAKLVPGLYAVCEAAQKAGAYNAVLSGAGPTILAVSEAKNGIPEKAGRAMVKEFAKHKVKSRYLVLDFDGKGATIFK